MISAIGSMAIIESALRITCNYIPAPSWLSFKVGAAAAVAFNGYNIWYDKFSAEGIAIAVILELCCFMCLGILSSHQKTSLLLREIDFARISDSIICFETAYFIHTFRSLEAMFGLYNVFMHSGFKRLHRKDIALAASSLLLLGFSTLGSIRLIGQATLGNK